jgi:flavin-dependent dehydrogenase
LERLHLTTGSKVLIIGGGPAGSFLAINLLRKAKSYGIELDVTIIEKKKAINSPEHNAFECQMGECNFCAGGLSSKVCEALRRMELVLPQEVILDKALIINIFSDWKTISLDVLREMNSVYRGAKPKGRSDSIYNFDSFLLESSVKEGAKVIKAEVTGLGYTDDGRLNVSINDNSQIIDSDFVAFAGGVNSNFGNGSKTGQKPVVCLQKIIPGFKAPRVRKTIIFELDAGDNNSLINMIAGELYFILHGSRSLKLEMISIIPKGKYVTVVLIGPSVDKSTREDNLRIINEFMNLPHIRKILPAGLKFKTLCVCTPNIVTGTAKHPYGNRIAVIGDMFTANLYKDGIGSAYEISANLAEIVITRGIDERSLREGYRSIIRKYNINNNLGKLVFIFIRIFFRNSFFSRIIYQAVITERKSKARENRRLEKILWNTASGEDIYKNIILSMYHPLAIWAIFSGGMLVTLRNYFTELIFGLKWGNFPRNTTGVGKEVFEANTKILRNEFSVNLGKGTLDFERMYSIRINAPGENIFRELGKFGNKDRRYFKPRFIDVTRTSGEPNQVGSIIRYNIFPKQLSFNLRLLSSNPNIYLCYEIMNGFGRGGILYFKIEPFKKGNLIISDENLLSIYVGFNFPRNFYMYLFPAYIHDVLWNFSLCQLKEEVEN